MKFPKNFWNKLVIIFGTLIGLFLVFEKLLTIYNSEQGHVILPSIFGIVAALIILVIQSLFRDKQEYLSYSIAIIGYPRSGKTTLIVSIFEEIIYRKISGIKATLKGDSTIERVNMLLERKKSGLSLGPTTDQTMFAYRTDIEIGKNLFSKTYRVEFGDYPGEYSEELADTNYFNHFKKTEFFKWCVEAHAYLLVIDVGKYLLAENKAAFIEQMTRYFRQSWQHFIDYNSNEVSNVKRKPVVLIFNKMDLSALIPKSRLEKNFLNTVNEAAYSLIKMPDVGPLDIHEYINLKKELTNSFNELITYFKFECKQFEVIFTSNFGKINDNYADVHKILEYIFPKKTTLGN